MRLRLTIIRHGLPATRILWTVASSAATTTTTARGVPASAVASTRVPNVAYGDEGCTIAQLLEDVNEVVPLETAISGGASTLGESDELGGQWGLEDYVVEVDGFECLHFMHVDGLLRDGDEVVIRSLGLGDLRARRLSGRLQVSTDGRRLIDGVPFGRHFLQRSYSSRPPIRIPPRKRRKTMVSSGWTGNLQNEEAGSDIFQRTASAPYDKQVALYDEEASVLPSEQGTVIRHPLNLFEDAGDSESDMDYSEGAAEDLAEELEQLRDEAEDAVSTGNITTHESGRKSRIAHRDPLPTSSPARPSLVSTPRTAIGRGTEIEATPKSSKSVRFEADKHIPSSQVSEHEDALDSDEQSTSDSESAVSSSDDDSSETSSDEDLVSHESESKFELESVSDGETSDDDSSTSEEEESESEPEVRKIKKPIDVFTPPGQGSSKTRNSNRRKKLRLRLQKLKSLGELPPEADFDDLRTWEAKHGKRPLTEVKDLEDLRESRVKEQTEIEAKRQLLLRVIASGGIDVDGCSEKENIPPRYTNGKQTENEVLKSVGDVETAPTFSKVSTEESAVETKAADADETASPSGIKRRKLDVSSTKRLLFGSLGVRTPKSKKDEEALRIKLEGSRNKYLTKAAETTAADTTETAVEDEIEDENWEKKIILSATECIFNDIKLATPPFPFYQRWDPDASYEIRQRRKNNKRNKKRKQRDWQDEAETGWYDGVTEDADEGGITLNYEDAPSAAQNEMQESTVNADEAEDLPTISGDPESLPSLTEDEATTGAIIAFKQLDMSKATNWQPQVSEYRVAKVIEVLDNGSLNVTLAKRDRETQQAVAVDENGVRTYSGFEMPEHEDEGVEDDNGFRNLSFQDLLEPKLLRSTSPQEKQGELVNGNHDESSLRDNNLPPSLPLPVSARGNDAEESVEADADSLPVAAAATATVSSETRLDISHMIRAPRRDSENAGSQDLGSSSNSSSSEDEYEFSSSPPEPGVEMQHGSAHNDTAKERDAMNLDERNGSMEDSGSQLNIDDGGDIDMGGGDDLHDNASTHDDGDSDGDSSDDGISLPWKNGELSMSTDESGLIETGSVEGHAASSHNGNSTAAVDGALENTTPVPRESTKNEAGPAQDVESQKEEGKGKGKGKEKEQAEDTSLSTTLRDGESHLQDSFITASAENETQSVLSDYSDAISTVPNPFYERDRIAMQAEERNADERPRDINQGDGPSSLPMHNSARNKPAESVSRHTQSIENGQIDDFNPGWLDQGDDHNVNDNANDSSDPEFPSIEVLWASTAPSREPFPPIKTEGDKPSVSGGDKNNHKTSSLPPSQSVAGRSSSPPFEPVTTTSTNNKSPATAKKRSRLIAFSYKKGQHQGENEQRRRKSSSSIPSLEVGSEQRPSSSNNQNYESHFPEHEDDNHLEQQLEEEEEEEEEEDDQPRNNPTPVMIDLTLSSPLVSPVDTGSDEDFARSQGLPRGPGWVRKNVPSTQRQTRSSTGGGILLSSSPPRPLQRRRRGRQTR
ncbi:hypothetical protein UA08_06195 [Talaromyces atroroseus]|uniref:Uncharacterized protein n=1 Tax=Talaromyces atroroseus TaxID=1441469 RepID=A0A225AC63_TALAT|nr:hypothetical protein UA08_06195 [Talaromyces atroroseus]OKL58652.1 hypothetical protein UA08_06195 [Talaromyces atroroseus]